jgi:hypothetical protein
MPIPPFNKDGDLPVAIYSATIDEVAERFGWQNQRRQELTTRLTRVFHLAKGTGKLDSLIIFGSYITSKENPNDVDIVLIFKDDFDISRVSDECKVLLDHQQAQDQLGVSLFWVRPSFIFLESLDEFVRGWQIKRDGRQRGIIEVKP